MGPRAQSRPDKVVRRGANRTTYTIIQLEQPRPASNMFPRHGKMPGKCRRTARVKLRQENYRCRKAHASIVTDTFIFTTEAL